MSFHNDVKTAFEQRTTAADFEAAAGALLAQYDEEISLADFAGLAGTNARTVNNWIASGKIEAVNKGAGEKRPRWFIRKSEIEKIQ